MIINYNRTVAYICPGCGEIAYGDFSLFELSGGRGISVSCDCKKSSLAIMPKNDTTYSVRVKCQVCEKNHEYAVPLSDLLRKNFLDFLCCFMWFQMIFLEKFVIFVVF